MWNENSHFLSFLKGVLYRVFGTLCTILISFVFTGSLKISVSIGIVEVISKILLYYFYERIWIFLMKKLSKKRQGNE